MHKPTTRLPLLTAMAVAVAPSLVAQNQQHLVVPAAFGATDAISFNWLAGASREVRQQTLIGANQLSAMVGKAIEAIEFRRSADSAAFAGGAAHMTVTMSTSAASTHEVSSYFASNHSPNSLQVFSGTVGFPTSPPAPGPSVGWTADNTVRIQLTSPFLYAGGRLCIDITGTPIAGQNANWWMADAEFEDIPGSVTDLGGGCGTYANSSFIAENSLVVGGYAHMTAYGSPLGLAVAAIGQSGSALPLALLGFNPPGNCNLMLGSLITLEPMLFAPDSNAIIASSGGRADLEIKIPNVAGAQGLRLATQWIDWSEAATTNALEWTIASTPTLDMVLIEGNPLEATGNVTAYLAHVMRFEYQ
jgi:hypothetical protein